MATDTAQKYLVWMADALTGNTLYLREISNFGNHWSYRREEAKRYDRKDAAKICKGSSRCFFDVAAENAK